VFVVRGGGESTICSHAGDCESTWLRGEPHKEGAFLRVWCQFDLCLFVAEMAEKPWHAQYIPHLFDIVMVTISPAR